ncbi:mucin-22-like [Kryptolebias marmoratus]|uniref:mucin-22-like n=1 Tax=Kryptolebias marmoratus TaxID=37003 RepID=UPI0007F92F56|nr:mucin-22-like [Kryptolebias marmoratus]
MPAAMMHLTVLVSLLTVAVCSETAIFSEPTQEPESTTTASHFPSSLATSSGVKTSAVTLQSQTTTTHQNATDVTSASPGTPRTEEPNPSSTTVNATTSQASNETTSQEQTVLSTSESQNASTSAAVNATSPALSANSGKNDLMRNPGLVAIICIFSIILALMIVVVTVKCIQSPKSNFERLEDVPMGKVNEESPFAHYSK